MPDVNGTKIETPKWAITTWITSLWKDEETIKQVWDIINWEILIRFGISNLSDLTEVWEPHKNLLSKSLWTYKWVDITFQSTRCYEWWFIAEHSHNNPKKNDITDELIIMMNEWWIYWDIGNFITEEWIMKIQAWDIHWCKLKWKSNWNWISLKPRGYTFIWIDNNDWWFFYWNWQREIKIMKLSWDKVFSTRKLWYKELCDKEDILFLEIWEWLVNIRKSTNDKILSSWDFIIIWEV